VFSQTNRYSIFLGSTRFSVISSIITIFIVSVFSLTYFLFPSIPALKHMKWIMVIKKQLTQLISVERPETNIVPIKSQIYEIPHDIKDFMTRACVLLSLDSIPDQRVGTGFLIEDSIDRTQLFLITALHNFYEPSYTVSHKKPSLRDPIYFLISCKQKGEDKIKVERIEVEKALKSGTLMIHPDSETFNDLAIYHFKMEPDVKYQFLKVTMLQRSEDFKEGAKIYTCGFGAGFYNRETSLLRPFCNEGGIDIIANNIASDTNMRIIPNIPFLKGYALIDMEREILSGTSGSPVFLSLFNMRDTTQVRLAGVLISAIGGVDQYSLLGKIAIGEKVRELIDQFNQQRSRFLPLKHNSSKDLY